MLREIFLLKIGPETTLIQLKIKLLNNILVNVEEFPSLPCCILTRQYCRYIYKIKLI